VRFRKRPVEVEAMQFDSTSAGVAIVRWAQGSVQGVFDDSHGEYLLVETLSGPVRAKRGEWVMRGVEGEFYPITDAILRASHDPLDEGRGHGRG